MIQQVVARCDRIEHPCDAIRCLVGCLFCHESHDSTLPGVNRERGCGEVHNPYPPVQVEGLLHLRQILIADKRLFVREERGHDRDADKIERRETRCLPQGRHHDHGDQVHDA